MTIRQEEHLNFIATTLLQWLTAKYTKGAEEHGGDLLDLTPLELIDEAINENIDQITYLLTLRSKL